MRRIVFFFLLAVSLATAACPQSRQEVFAKEAVEAPVVRVPILMYHKVDTIAHSEWWVSTALFARQMDALKAYGYETISLREYLRCREGLAQPPEKPVIITFDDGYKNIFTEAAPVLMERGMSATLFITTGLIGDNEQERQTNAWDRPDSQFRADHLIWPEIKALHEAGFEIASHTISHPALDRLRVARIREELVVSREMLEKHLGEPVEIFSYPYGRGADQQRIHNLLAEAGYRLAVDADPDGMADMATSDLWALPRITITEEHTVDLDPGRPDQFFLRRVDPEFPLPDLHHGLECRRQDNSPTEVVQPGETVNAVVTVINRGAPSNVRITLELYSGDGDDLLYYRETAEKNLPAQEQKLVFEITVPAGISPGRHYYRLIVQDDHAVLGFMDSRRQPFFILRRE